MSNTNSDTETSISNTPQRNKANNPAYFTTRAPRKNISKD